VGKSGSSEIAQWKKKEKTSYTSRGGKRNREVEVKSKKKKDRKKGQGQTDITDSVRRGRTTN